MGYGFSILRRKVHPCLILRYQKKRVYFWKMVFRVLCMFNSLGSSWSPYISSKSLAWIASEVRTQILVEVSLILEMPYLALNVLNTFTSMFQRKILWSVHASARTLSESVRFRLIPTCMSSKPSKWVKFGLDYFLNSKEYVFRVILIVGVCNHTIIGFSYICVKKIQ